MNYSPNSNFQHSPRIMSITKSSKSSMSSYNFFHLITITGHFSARSTVRMTVNHHQKYPNLNVLSKIVAINCHNPTQKQPNNSLT